MATNKSTLRSRKRRKELTDKGYKEVKNIWVKVEKEAELKIKIKEWIEQQDQST